MYYYLTNSVSSLPNMPRGKTTLLQVREIVVNLHLKNKTNTQIGKLVNLSRYTVRDIVQLYKKNKSVHSKPRYKPKTSITEHDIRSLRRVFKKDRRSNMTQLTRTWNESTEKSFGRSTTSKTLRKMGYKYYKV